MVEGDARPAHAHELAAGALPAALTGRTVPINAPHGVPGLIRDMYQRTRDQIVCADHERALTGHQLELLSDIVAARIRGTVSAPGPVALRMRRGVQRAVAMLGVLKSGRAYLPIELDEPAPRVRLMVDQARPAAVLGEAGEGLIGLPVVEIPEKVEAEADEPAPLAEVAPGQLVYVMFTSGSTGSPKGVMLGSDALCTRLLWMQRAYPLGRDDRVLQKTPYTFDPSGWEVFWPLIAGARGEFAPDGAHRDPSALARVMAERGITVCHFVPSLLAEFQRAAAAASVSSLRRVFCSGEALTAPVARRCFDLWPGASLHNLYGPTEAAIDVTYWDVPRDLPPGKPVLIGMPVDNTVLAVVGGGITPVPYGEPGELWIGGDQLAAGYAGRPDLTAQAFPEVAGRRWYRTGDIVRQVPGGLAYLGRIDDQVKIGGVRVEPIEAERVLADLSPQVAVVAVADESGPALVAVLGGDGAADLADDDLRRYAAARLPAALVPSGFLRLPDLPVTASGKLDRGLLRERAAQWRDQGETAAETDPLGAAWARALRASGPIDASAGFVTAGGNSLAAIRLIAAVRESLETEIALSDLLDENMSLTQLRELTGRVAAAPPRAPRGPGATRKTSPLAPEQRRLWLLSRIYPDLPAYNVAVAVRFTGDVSVPALEAALRAAAGRHDIFRASVAQDAAGAPFLVYQDEVPVELAVTEAGTGTGTDAEGDVAGQVVDDFIRESLNAVISDARAPMFRARLLRSAQRGVALLTLVFNHLIADQRTIEIVMEGLPDDYASALAGKPAASAAVPSFAEYAASAASRAGDDKWTADLAHWQRRLAGSPPEISLPFRRAADNVERDFAAVSATVSIGQGLDRRLAAYLRDRGATTAAFFLAVYGWVLSAWSGQSTVVIGTPGSRRRTSEEEALAGFLMETLPIRLDLDGLRTFDDVLAHARSRYVEAMDHGRPSFDAVVSALRPASRSGRNPVFQVWLNDLTGAAPAPALAGLDAGYVLPPAHAALFDVGLYLHRAEAGLVLRVVTAADLYASDIAAALLDQCVAVASQVVAEPGIALDDLRLSAPEATRALPAPPAELPPAGARTAVTGDVAAIVARSPDAVAIASPEGELTYQQLWKRASQAAAGLARAGMRAGDRVAILAGRDADLPVALIACWMAGAEAALVDARLPEARRREAAQSVRAALTVTTRASAAGEGFPSLADLMVRDGPSAGADAAHPGGLSHVLFTSGTTGAPAPVAVPHGPLRDFLRWYADTFGLGPADRFALLAGPGHDPVLREMFGALTVGGRLCIPPHDLTAGDGRLLSWMENSGITVLHATPALLEVMLQSDTDPVTALGTVRLLVIGGAPLSWGLARRLGRVTRAAIVNVYGATETPQVASWYRLPADDPGYPNASTVPVGAGTPGHQLLVLTRAGRLAGIGERGEVVVRSRNLASGYLNGHGNPGSFAADPWGEAAAGRGEAAVRAFRTGDLGRYGTDGLVWLDGRADRQVSIGGHRLELAEIEATALRHPLVRQAIATLSDGVIGPVLSLQVTTTAPVEAAEIRTFLSGLLPDYAVPPSVHVAGQLKLGNTGKVTAAPVPALAAGGKPAADAGHPAARPRQAALDRLEHTVLEVLGRSLGPDENFFDAGLTSLSLIELHRVCVRDLSDPFPVTALFAYPNLRLLRRYLTDGGEVAQPSAPGRADGSRLRKLGDARREMRRQLRSETP